jgi:hypothetical protein
MLPVAHRYKGEKRAMIVREEFAKIAPGDTIGYLLKTADSPIDPQRVWRGQVISINKTNDTAIVVVLDEGYGDESEHVTREQIVTVEHGTQKAMKA